VMPYKLGMTGKHKVTGDLAMWVQTFRQYFTADFLPGTLPERPNLAFESYLAVLESFLARACRTRLPTEAYYQPALPALAATATLDRSDRHLRRDSAVPVADAEDSDRLCEVATLEPSCRT